MPPAPAHARLRSGVVRSYAQRCALKADPRRAARAAPEVRGRPCWYWPAASRLAGSFVSPTAMLPASQLRRFRRVLLPTVTVSHADALQRCRSQRWSRPRRANACC